MSTFLARFHGPCAADCGDPIRPDDEVTYVADELMHAECAGVPPTAPPPEERPCPDCWTVHRGECL